MGVVRNSVHALSLAFSMAASVPAWHFMNGHLTYSSLPKDNKVDVVMVFTGSSNRIVQGYNLYLAGMTDRLMITGKDYPETSLEPEIATLADKANEKKVYIDAEAGSTIENAINGAGWVLKNDIKSILLITSNKHMARSYFELRRLLPADVKIYADTVPGLNLGSGLDTERTRLLCRMYETVLQKAAPSSGFCYQTRELARHWGVLAMNSAF